MRKADVAATVGVDRATVWRWTKSDQFKVAVDRELRNTLDATRLLVVDGQLKALRFLVDTIDDASAERRDRLAAAKALLAACPPPEPAAPAPEPPSEERPLLEPEEARFLARELLKMRLRKQRLLALPSGEPLG